MFTSQYTMARKIIPLEDFLKVIPERDFRNPDFKGVRFLPLYNKLRSLGIKGTGNQNYVRKDLEYYVKLGFFGRIHNETYKQPIFYRTHIGGDLVTDMGLLDGLKFVKTLLDGHFKGIDDEWKKIEKKKFFLKSGKPSKKFPELEKWVELFDPVIIITTNLMFTRETMDYDMLKNDYSKLIKDTIKEVTKFAKKAYSSNKINGQPVIVLFAKIPFSIKF